MKYTIQKYLNALPTGVRRGVLKFLFNRIPSFRGSGGRVTYLDTHLRNVTIALPFNWRTRNLNGSIYGGSIGAVTDGVIATMLIWALGHDYVVWDKSVSIEFRRPARTHLHVCVELHEDEIQTILERLAAEPEITRDYEFAMRDDQQNIYSIVRRTVYIARRSFYAQKIRDKKDNLLRAKSTS